LGCQFIEEETHISEEVDLGCIYLEGEAVILYFIFPF